MVSQGASAQLAPPLWGASLQGGNFLLAPGALKSTWVATLNCCLGTTFLRIFAEKPHNRQLRTHVVYEQDEQDVGIILISRT